MTKHAVEAMPEGSGIDLRVPQAMARQYYPARFAGHFADEMTALRSVGFSESKARGARGTLIHWSDGLGTDNVDSAYR